MMWQDSIKSSVKSTVEKTLASCSIGRRSVARLRQRTRRLIKFEYGRRGTPSAVDVGGGMGGDGASAAAVIEGRTAMETRVETRPVLTEAEIKKLVHCAQLNEAHGLRNSLLILILYRYALRVSEVLAIKWSDINLGELTIMIRRQLSDGPTVYRLNAVEASLLLRLKREARGNSAFVFAGDRGQALTTRAAYNLIAQAAEQAELGGNLHPHMLRQARAAHLASAGVDMRSIQNFLGQRRAAVN